MSRKSAPPPDGVTNVVQFGAFQLDIAAGELRKYGMRVRLQNQPLKILEALISRPGQVFTREELVAIVWPKGTFVDFDRGLNASMTRLRQALGDSAESPRYVETVSGRGYRFIAPLQTTRNDFVEARAGRLWMWIACAAALGIALFGISSFKWLRSGTSAETSPTRIPPAASVPLTAEPGEELHPSLSPDGNHVAFAYARDDSGDFDIYIKTIGSDGMVRLISGPAHELSPAWSPDGRSIAFIRLISDTTASVLQVPVEGGPERQIGQISLPRFGQTKTTVGHLLAWSPDGKWVATSSRRAPDAAASLLMISVLTGQIRWITQPPISTWGDFSPSYSPNGERLTFARYVGPTVSDIYLVNLTRDSLGLPEATRLTRFNSLSSSPIWISGGNEILFSCDCLSHHRRFWRIPAPGSGAKATPVEGVGENGFSVSFSSEQKRLAYSTQTADTDIWRLELSRSGKDRAKISRVISSTRLENTPEYSPDGRQIAYQSERAGRDEIWVANSDGSSSRQLTRLESKVSGFPRWSPDGRLLVFHSRVDGPANLFIVDTVTGALRRLTQGTGENNVPSWSRDGKWVYFTSRRTGQYQIWKAPQAGGEEVQVTKTGGSVGFESIDGRSLIFSKSEDGGIWVLDLASGAERQIPVSLSDTSTFAVGKSGVYVMSNPNSQPTRQLNLVNYRTGEIIRLAEISSRVNLGLSVSPDETSVLYTQLEYRGADLSLIEKFR